MDRPPCQPFETEVASVALPQGMYGVVVPAPPECVSMAHLRGEISPGAPAFGVLSTRARDDTSVARCAEELAASLVPPVRPPRPVHVPGSKQALRLDGRFEIEEGLGREGVERIALVVARARRVLVVLTVRTRPDDDVAEDVDHILGSFTILED